MKDDSILQSATLRENVLLKNVYLWLVLGLVVSAVVGYAVSISRTLQIMIYGNAFSLIFIVIAEFALVFFLSARLETMKASSAVISFIAYSVLTGFTLGSVFLLFAPSAIAKAFLSSAGVFIGAALYATFTKRDVRSWGRYLFMGLWGLIFASLINMFFRSSMLDFGISILGVVIFTFLTAWDTRRILDINRNYGPMMTNDELTKIGIMGALELYLDFINIFLYLIRIFGSRDN